MVCFWLCPVNGTSSFVLFWVMRIEKPHVLPLLIDVIFKHSSYFNELQLAALCGICLRLHVSSCFDSSNTMFYSEQWFSCFFCGNWHLNSFNILVSAELHNSSLTTLVISHPLCPGYVHPHAWWLKDHTVDPPMLEIHTPIPPFYICKFIPLLGSTSTEYNTWRE